MKHINLSVVRSPLQAFNCIEANKRFSEQNSAYLLVLFRKDVDRELINQVIGASDFVWDRIIYCDIRSNLQQFLTVLSLLMKLRQVNYCFIGDTTHIINLLINSIAVEKIVKIDDGASTYRDAIWIATKLFRTQNRHQQPIPAPIRITDRLLRLGPLFWEKTSFFTIYDSIKRNTGDLEVIHNDYRFFKQQIVDLPIKKEIFFIGSDIKRYVLKEEDRFEFYLSAVARYYQGKNWTYILHRKENENLNQRNFMEEMARKYNFKLRVFDRIIEQEILHQGWQPQEIATFFSSAIDSLVAIYHPVATVFKLRAEDVRETSQFALNEMHRNYRELNLNIVEI